MWNSIQRIFGFSRPYDQRIGEYKRLLRTHTRGIDRSLKEIATKDELIRKEIVAVIKEKNKRGDKCVPENVPEIKILYNQFKSNRKNAACLELLKTCTQSITYQLDIILSNYRLKGILRESRSLNTSLHRCMRISTMQKIGLSSQVFTDMTKEFCRMGIINTDEIGDDGLDHMEEPETQETDFSHFLDNIVQSLSKNEKATISRSLQQGGTGTQDLEEDDLEPMRARLNALKHN